MNEKRGFHPLQSIRVKMGLLMGGAIVTSMTIATFIAALSISRHDEEASHEELLLLCQAGQKNLNTYFTSVSQAVETVSDYIDADLIVTDLATEFGEHMERAKDFFAKTAERTMGALTYYYRIDPEVSTSEKGFWFVNLDGTDFVEHEVTDISLYDTTDTSTLVWFTVPKNEGKSIWLPPYMTENLDVYVISYNVPIYKNNTFIGVVGVEIDYTTMAKQVDNIKLYDHGYAFINDQNGKIIYHPLFDVLTEKDPEKTTVPEGILSDQYYVTYRFDGVEKIGAWLNLNNGMRLNVAVPVDEIFASRNALIMQMSFAALGIATVFITLTILFAVHITKPLSDLTKIARRINEGDYTVKIEYHGNDEIAELARTVNTLVDHLDGYIKDLNSLAYADALTSVRNKGAFDLFAEQMQKRIENPEDHPKFAIAIFDCDDLKVINDRYGHDKGDIYLKNSSHLICRVYEHSAVFRIGGDEFAAVLVGEDYDRANELSSTFLAKSAEISSFAKAPWEEIRVSMGVAFYDENTDKSIYEVSKRADQSMYEHKRSRKK